MTKEELQARLKELNERQAQENRRSMEIIGSLIEAYEHGNQDLADRLRDSKMEETLRHKAANLDIDCERQRLRRVQDAEGTGTWCNSKQDGGR